MIMRYRTYLFDFDGTLVDSMPVYISLMLRILDEHKIPYGSDIIKTITPMGFVGGASYFISMGLDMPHDQLVALMRQRAYDEYAFRIPAKPHVISTLRELKAIGCDLNVLTASPHTTLDPCLKRLGIYDLFTHVWSCEDFQTTKADPRIYDMAAQQIGTPKADILFLDDNYNADLSAKNAGMAVCGVYDASSAEYEDEIKAIADHYIHDFSELLK